MSPPRLIPLVLMLIVVLAIIYFALVGRRKLILSPEEEFAMTRGVHGHPETEGYGQTHLADIAGAATSKQSAST